MKQDGRKGAEKEKASIPPAWGHLAKDAHAIGDVRLREDEKEYYCEHSIDSACGIGLNGQADEALDDELAVRKAT